MCISPFVGILLGILPPAGPDGAAKKPPTGVKTFNVPGTSHAMAIRLPGYQVQFDRVIQGGQGRYVMLSNERTGISVSFWLLPADGKGGSAACREKWWAKELANPVKPYELQKRELGDLALVDYETDSPMRMAHERAYAAHRGTWADIHLSKIGKHETCRKSFDHVLKTVKFVQSETTDVKNELKIARGLHESGEYVSALEHYRKVVEAEDHKRTLSPELWRIAVNNMGLCYVLIGHSNQAKASFQYGVSKDPEYPLFHYNLARSYAAKDDLQNAIASLKSAFTNRKNLNEGEHMPNPRKDSSFKKYLKDKEFKKALREIES